jgi:hypothetical protein
MKLLRLASLSLVAALSLSGCASDKYYDLGSELGSSANFVNAWGGTGGMIEGVPEVVNRACKEAYKKYLQKTGDREFANASSENLRELVKGCKNGFDKANPYKG